MDKRIAEALDVIADYGTIDGAHHKQWVLDQVVRKLCGTIEKYRAWLVKHAGDDWDTGIPP